MPGFALTEDDNGSATRQVNLLAHFQPIRPSQADVQKNEVGTSVPDKVKSLFARPHFDDVELLRRKNGTQNAPKAAFTPHNEDNRDCHLPPS
jgi:hypothetical protein